QFIRPLADADFVVFRRSLTLLVEGHDDDRGAITATQLGPPEEFGFAVSHADRIDDRLALHGFEARFENGPFAAVDHDWHGGDIVLAGDQPQELGHYRFAVKQTF